MADGGDWAIQPLPNPRLSSLGCMHNALYLQQLVCEWPHVSGFPGWITKYSGKLTRDHANSKKN
jgi:hypothetical protein